MRTKILITMISIVIPSIGFSQDEAPYRAHDLSRPHPPIVTPAGIEKPVPPPSDAIILFDGSSLEKWSATNGKNSKWVLENGVMHPTRGSGPIQTRDKFGDVQLHIEWATPTPPKGKSQGRGNSGVYFMTKYEVQVLDSYENLTYADGQAASMYGQNPPMVNASLPPGVWQSYDIVFRRPHFNDDGSLKKPAVMTVFHNGVLVQDHFELWGPTNWLKFSEYQPHENELPIRLQDHGNPVLFRNIWLRKLNPVQHYKHMARLKPILDLSEEELAKFVGKYQGGRNVEIQLNDGNLQARFFGRLHNLVATKTNFFELEVTDGSIEFKLDEDGVPNELVLTLMGDQSTSKK